MQLGTKPLQAHQKLLKFTSSIMLKNKFKLKLSNFIKIICRSDLPRSLLLLSLFFIYPHQKNSSFKKKKKKKKKNMEMDSDSLKNLSTHLIYTND